MTQRRWKTFLACILVLMLTATMLPLSAFAATTDGVPPLPTRAPKPSQNNPAPAQACSHSWGEWKIVRNSTCSQAGSQYRVCRRCSQQQRQALPLEEHQWGDWTVIQEMTNHSAGIREHTCAVCGNTGREVSYPDGTIRPGAKGDDVKALQQVMVDAGLYKGNITSIYDKKSEYIVRDYQKMNGMDVDGIAWPLVQDTMTNQCAVTKTITSTPANGEYYVEGEEIHYLLTFNNYVNLPAANVVIEEPMLDGDNKVIVQEDNVENYGRTGTEFVHVVTADDVAAGSVSNQADGSWVDTKGTQKNTVSEIVIAPTKPHNDPQDVFDPDNQGNVFDLNIDPAADEDPDADPDEDPDDQNDLHDPLVSPLEYSQDAILLEKAVANSPANGQHFVPGEVIDFSITLTNNTPEDIKGVFVFDYMDTSSPIGQQEFIAPMSQSTYVFSHAVTDIEVETQTTLLNDAYAAWDDSISGAGTITSNTVSVPIGPKAYGEVSLVKSVTSSPANGQFYTEGEAVDYVIEFTNNTGATITDIVIIDPLVGANYEGNMIVGIQNVLADGESIICGATVIVSAADVEHTEIINTATATFINGNGIDDSAVSNTVVVPTGTEPLTIIKSVSSTPANGTAYTLNETVNYTISITNNTSDPITGIMVVDNRLQDSKGPYDLDPGWTALVEFYYIVQEQDIVDGQIENIADVTWDGGSGISNMVTVYTTDGDPGTLIINKTRTNQPANGQYYVPGETIDYEIFVANYTPLHYHWTDVYDLLDDSSSATVAYGAFPSGFSDTILFHYQVKESDVTPGLITTLTNSAYITGQNPETEQFETVYSNPVDAPVGMDSNSDTLTITKQRTNQPANGQYYVPGEIIDYEIFVANYTPLHYDFTDVYDMLESSSSPIWPYGVFPSGFSDTFYYHYEVKESDVTSGLITTLTNIAYITGQNPETEQFETVYSNPVDAPVGKDPSTENTGTVTETPESAPVITPGNGAGTADHCSRTIVERTTGGAVYIVHYCAQHDATRLMTETMTATADAATSAMAWEYACSLWKADLDALYDQLCQGANDQGVELIHRERDTFETLVAARGLVMQTLYPDEPERAMQAMTKMLMDHVVDLCYLLNTAPAERTDLLTCLPVTGTTPGTAAVCTQESSAMENGDISVASHFCMIHSTTAAITNSLITAANNSVLNWKKIVQLWQIELDRYYNASTGAAGMMAFERESFLEWTEAYGELLTVVYPNDPVVAQKVLLSVLMDQVVDFCCAGDN